MNRLHADYSAKGLDIIAISNESQGEFEAFVAQTNIEYPVYRDPTNQLAPRFGVGGIPASFVIDADNRIVWAGHPMDPALHTLISAQLDEGG